MCLGRTLTGRQKKCRLDECIKDVLILIHEDCHGQQEEKDLLYSVPEKMAFPSQGEKQRNVGCWDSAQTGMFFSLLFLSGDCIAGIDINFSRY